MRDQPLTSTTTPHDRPRSLLLALPLLAAPTLSACGDDSSAEDSASTAPTDSDESGDPIPDIPPPESLAHDIDIDVVAINQGVEIPISVAGQWVDGPDRNAPIVAGRKMILRAYWQRAPEFVAREIEARLIIDTPEGEPVEERVTMFIDEEPYPGTLDRAFLFDFLEHEVVPGMSFSISLWEVEPEFAALEPPAVEPISPRDGSLAAVGVQPEPAELKIVVVPVHVEWDGCSTTPPAAELLPLFEDMMFMKNPSQRVTLSIRDTPIVLTTPLDSLWSMMEPLQLARDEDQADPNTYYYGLMDACTTGIGGAGGMAYSVAPGDEEFGWQRVATGLWYGDDQWAADTLVHEIGHLQGLAHVFCPGQNAAEPEPAYPYEDGVIGVWGFGLLDFAPRSPTASHDFMSYCYDGNWSSDWTWSKTFDRIRSLTSWDYEGGAGGADLDGRIVIGVLPDEGGAPRWWTTRGRFPAQLDGALTQVEARASTSDARPRPIDLRAIEQRVADQPATVVAIELPGSRSLRAVELPTRALAVPAEVLAP